MTVYTQPGQPESEVSYLPRYEKWIAPRCVIPLESSSRVTPTSTSRTPGSTTSTTSYRSGCHVPSNGTGNTPISPSKHLSASGSSSARD